MGGLERLTALAVKNKRTPGYFCDGGGLYLQVAKGGSKSWVFRYTLKGKTRDMGLGSLNALTLADARDKARELRALRTQGIDPIDARVEQARKTNLARLNSKTFSDCVITYIKDHRSEWRNPKHAQQWENTLKEYAEPILGKILVQDITAAHIKQVLDPIWTSKRETATRVRGRIEKVLDAAKALKYRSGENPAAWRGNLDNLLAKQNKKVRNHPALPWALMYEFMIELRKHEGVGPKALEFAILTAARSGEVRLATWSEVDLDARLWVCPAGHMKMKVEHTVPLSDSALELLRGLPQGKSAGLIFPNLKSKKPISDATMSKLIKDMNDAVGGKRWINKKGECATPHGFRSALTDWAMECTHHVREVREMALAHAVESAVEGAYRRGELLMKRAELMQDWATYCNTPRPKGNVIPMVQKKGAA